MNPLFYIDFYKADHRRQYPDGAEVVYSNFTARSGKLTNLGNGFDGGVVFFGLQHFIKKVLIDDFGAYFFARPKAEVVSEYRSLMDDSLGKGAIDCSHIEALHDLGYLPIKIKALPEGTFAPIGVPMLTIQNTIPQFFWLTNYLETIMSAMLWKPCVSATTARAYKKLLTQAAKDTSGDFDFLPFQAHDFSFRGMSGLEDAMLSGAAHLLYFNGTDSVPAIKFLEKYYKADSAKEFIAGSVPATEHSVMCMGERAGEIETFKRLIQDIYPSGIVSIVSDTWDFWKVLTDYLPKLKDIITQRDGKVVIRPDSGDPVKIICGDESAKAGTPEHKGAIQVLWDLFGGTISDKGFRLLDSHIGLIYGDSITYQRADEIMRGLAKKGFASTNVVLGVGSFTYQYVTRDTYGFAVKATYGKVNGRDVAIYKDPVTDDGTKKSLQGLVRVNRNEAGELFVIDNCDSDYPSLLETVFLDGELLKDESLGEIRKRCDAR